MASFFKSRDLSLSTKGAVVFFLLALVGHFYFATYNFRWGFMVGHEFRQAQTALISEYIDKQDNFGIYYETPILGKPWAFPLEFPLYQWTVVGVKRGLDIKLFEAARGVSLASFYAALPAFWLLLGSCGLSAARRWVILGVTLFCPALIFYSRAFLIDPMAMALSAWFLAAFVRAMDTRRWPWLLLAALAGTAGVLVKSLVFAVWLFPAAGYGAWCLWRTGRERGWGRPVWSTIGWGLGAVVLPLGALKWWIAYTDAIKEGHRSAYIFTSKNLSVGNFGTFSLDSRLSVETWREMFKCWSQAIAAPWIVGLFLALCLLLCRRGRDRGLIVLAVAVWMFGQLAFPYAYAYQDYYFYAGVAFLMFAFGVGASALLEHGRGPLIVRGLIALLPCVGMARAYAADYFQAQRVQSHGGSGMAEVLRDFLPPDSVIVGLGEDWSAILPYYAKHRALMVRNGLDADYAYLEGAIEDLADEDIGAVVFTGAARENRETVRFMLDRLGLVKVPLFTHRDSVVYVSPIHFARMRALIEQSNYSDVVLGPENDESAQDGLVLYRLSQGSSRVGFPMVEPGVSAYRIKFGFNRYPVDGRWMVSVHPPSDLWVAVRGPMHGAADLEFGLTDPAWNREVSYRDKTDGVEFELWAEDEGGARRNLWRRFLNPRDVEADRGLQHAVANFTLRDGEKLVLTTRPGETMSYDWAYLAAAKVTESTDDE